MTATQWSLKADFKTQLQKRWNRGDLHRQAVEALLCDVNLDSEIQSAINPQLIDNYFPLKLNFKKPTAKQAGTQFSEVQAWIKTLEAIRYLRIDWQERQHRQLGRNNFPVNVWIDTLDDALAFLGKQTEMKKFIDSSKELIATNKDLLPWLMRYPHKVDPIGQDWQALLSIHRWMQENTRPNIYLRQVDLPGVHTKIIESHRKTLSEWFDLTLPETAIDSRFYGQGGFTKRYGFRDKPLMVRMRSLDKSKPIINGANGHCPLTQADLSLDLSSANELQPACVNIVITENEVNYLALSDYENTLAVFGGGYALESLHLLNWLSQKNLIYWGDIDTHGFRILSRLRARFPTVRSVLMDETTLLNYKSSWVFEDKQDVRDLDNLTVEETQLFNKLRDNVFGAQVRLEQECIGFADSTDAIALLLQ